MASNLSAPAAPHGGFLRWWLGELGSAMPGRARHTRPPRHALYLRRNGERVEVFRRRGRSAERLGVLDLPPPLPAPAGVPTAPVLPPQARKLIDLMARRRSPVILVLEEDEGLLCHDLLPGGAEAELDRIMPHRVDLITPWTPDRVHAGYRVLGKRPDGQIEVLLGAVPRPAIDPTLSRLSAYGVKVDVLDLLDESGDPAGLNLLRREAAGGSGRRWWPALAILLALLAGGGVLAGREIHELHTRLEARERFASALEQRLADLPDLRSRIEALRRNADFIPAQQRQAPSPIVVLEVLSRVLPDSIWLDQVALDGAELSLSGYAEDAAQVLPIIESSAHFSDAQFRAPSTRVTVPGPGGGEREVERFSLSAQVEPLPEPEP